MIGFLILIAKFFFFLNILVGIYIIFLAKEI
jgi:hypothetical protein